MLFSSFLPSFIPRSSSSRSAPSISLTRLYPLGWSPDILSPLLESLASSLFQQFSCSSPSLSLSSPDRMSSTSLSIPAKSSEEKDRKGSASATLGCLAIAPSRLRSRSEHLSAKAISGLEQCAGGLRVTEEVFESVNNLSSTFSHLSAHAQSQSGVTIETLVCRLASFTFAVPNRAATKCVVVESTSLFTVAPKALASRYGLDRSRGTWVGTTPDMTIVTPCRVFFLT